MCPFRGRLASGAVRARPSTGFSRDFGAGFPAAFRGDFVGRRTCGFPVFRGVGFLPGAFERALPAGRADFPRRDFPAGLPGFAAVARRDFPTIRARFGG
jgi:hypothetical protein